jgi:hypothetical protein
MKLRARFDQLLSEMRLLFEEAAGHAEVIDKLENYLSERRLFGGASRRERRSRDPVLSPEKKEAIKTTLLRVLTRAKDGMKISGLARTAGIEGFRLRLLLGELRAEKKVRLEGDKGGARYVAMESERAGKATTRDGAGAKRKKRPTRKQTSAKAKPSKSAPRPKAARAAKATKPTRVPPAKKGSSAARRPAASTTKGAAPPANVAAAAASTAAPPSGDGS